MFEWEDVDAILWKTFPSQVPTTENSALFIQTMPIITLVTTA